ncbi:MAG TPA: DUF1844 domain-containing protein [bacterium]|nr:DUF1844 domain-containing protein [bacterium]
MPEPLNYKDNREWGTTDYYFIDLVVMLASSAKIDLGELVHPYYKDKDLNLPRARMTINMITSLIKKTSGNLNIEEKKVLREVLDDLQKTYVEKTKEKAKAGGPAAVVPMPARPLVPTPPTPKKDVKEWISMVQQELAKKKQNPPNKS